MLGLNIENVIGLFGSGALLATLILVAIAISSGYLLGGPGRDTRQVLAIGTGQRNLAATFLIAGNNFSDQPDVRLSRRSGTDRHGPRHAARRRVRQADRIGDRHASRHAIIDGGACGWDMNARG